MFEALRLNNILEEFPRWCNKILIMAWAINLLSFWSHLNSILDSPWAGKRADSLPQISGHFRSAPVVMSAGHHHSEPHVCRPSSLGASAGHHRLARLPAITVRHVCRPLPLGTRRLRPAITDRDMTSAGHHRSAPDVCLPSPISTVRLSAIAARHPMSRSPPLLGTTDSSVG